MAFLPPLLFLLFLTFSPRFTGFPSPVVLNFSSLQFLFSLNSIRNSYLSRPSATPAAPILALQKITYWHATACRVTQAPFARSTSTTAPHNPVQQTTATVSTALEVSNAFAKQVSRAIFVKNKSTTARTHKHVKTMVQGGFLEISESGGPKCLI